ncbi:MULTISPECIES: hypothetical protein [Pseudomonas]|nr:MULTISPECIES: hypothetical protein [Pseudomonas]WEW96203.1 hypothetical protein P3T65_18390 [Pseudomonas nitroreducens]
MTSFNDQPALLGDFLQLRPLRSEGFDASPAPPTRPEPGPDTR